MTEMKYGQTKGTGMHVNNSYYDNVDDRPPLDGELDGRENKPIITDAPEIKVGDKVLYGEQGYGKITSIWEDEKSGKTKFTVLFDVGRHECEFNYPTIFIYGLMTMV